MNYQALFARAGDRDVKVGLVGVGDFGTSLLARSLKIPNLEITVICDQDRSRMEAAASVTGMDAAQVVMTDNIMGGTTPDFDVLVEATGQPEAAAIVAEWAIGEKHHVVMASKEAAIVCGPMLHELASRQGVVYTEIDGDQPSLLIGLVSWAHTLGLDIVAAGKSSEYDFILDGDELCWLEKSHPASGLKALWHESGEGWPKLVANREQAAINAGFPTRTVPDFCEMGVVANATGLEPDRAGFHAPLLRSVELADVFQEIDHGGIMASSGRVDVFNCFRRNDESSFAGGVFVVVSCDDEKTWELLRGKGHVVAKNGRAAMLYNPQHLLGVEAPISILSAGLLGLPTGASEPKPRFDLVARAGRDFKKGDVLEITDHHHHEVSGLSPELLPAAVLEDANPCPYYLATNKTLVEDVVEGSVITAGMLELDNENALYRLRRMQDHHFLE